MKMVYLRIMDPIALRTENSGIIVDLEASNLIAE